MSEYQIVFRLSKEDKQLTCDLAELLQTSQVMAFRMVVRELVPALKVAKGKEKGQQAIAFHLVLPEVVPALKAAKGKDIRRPSQSRPAN